MSKSFVVAAIRELAATNNSIRCVMREVGGAVALVKAIATLQKNGKTSLPDNRLLQLTVAMSYNHLIQLAKEGRELPPSISEGWKKLSELPEDKQLEARKLLVFYALFSIGNRLGDITSYLDD